MALFLALVASALLIAPDSAQAHGVQITSVPAPNTQLDTAPELISVTFSEPIEPSVSTIQLWDQAGQPVTLGALGFPDGTTMAIAVPPGLSPGFYTVIWRNLSKADGHIWSGSYPFVLLDEDGQVPSGASASIVGGGAQEPSSTPSTLESAARWVVLLASAIMLGGTAYVLFVVAPAARVLSGETGAALRGLSRTVLLTTVAIAVFLALEGSLLQLVVQAEHLGGLGRVDELLIDTRLGHYLLARQGLLLIALVVVGLLWRAGGGRLERPALALLLLASVGVLLTQSLVSHAAASDGAFWATSVDFLHLSATALWVGGLIHIGLAMPRWLDELEDGPRTLFAAESFRRFSVVAAVSVVVLLASGVLSALVQFTSWEELWSTSYGWSLIGKMAAMLPLLAVAALNAFVLQPRVIEAADEVNGAGAGEASMEAVSRLQRLLAMTVRAEAVLGIAVLVAVAVLIQLQAPRTSAEAAELAEALSERAQEERGYFQDAVELEGLIVSLRIEPAQLGQNSFELGLGSEFGAVGEVQQVRLQFDHEQEGVGGTRAEMTLMGSLRYLLDGSFFSLPGEWTVTANIRRRGEDDLQASFGLRIGLPSNESESIWRWPFDGGQSVGAIAVLGAVGAGAAGWQLLRLRRRV